MIYSKFGSTLTPVSKYQAAGGRLLVQATAEGSTDVFEYFVGDLKADGGLTEIHAVVAKLPWKVIGKNVERRRQTPL